MKVPPKTALITGASSGLGAAFARALASEGCRCTLVARSTDRLRSLAEEIREAAHTGKAGSPNSRMPAPEVHTKAFSAAGDTGTPGIPAPEVHTADLARPEDLAAAAEIIEAERPELLVLNAGFGLPDPFAECAPGELSRMVNVHVHHVVRLLRAYLGKVSGPSAGSMVIVVASVAAFTPAPMAALYTATKRFQVELVRALAVGHPGTCFQVLCPGLVHTDFHRRMGHSRRDRPGMLPWWDADDVVRYSLKKLGSGKLIVVPGAPYRLLLILRALIPDPVYRAFMRRFSRFTPLEKGL